MRLQIYFSKFQLFLGDPTSILPTVWPELPELSENETQKLFSKFATKYRAHYEEIVNALGNLQFSSVEMIWQKFWQRTDPSENEGIFCERLLKN